MAAGGLVMAGPGTRSVVVVLGMHRSGTSLAAKAIQVLGVELGDRLWLPKEDNPTGFWEDRDVVDLNERLFSRMGISWRSLAAPEESAWEAGDLDELRREAAALLEARLARHGGAWGFKDPRTARALPFWKGIFRALGIETSYVLTVRNPVNVAASLTRRDSLPEVHSHVLWLEHLHGALAGTAGARRCIVDYDALVEQPAAQLRRLAGALGLEVTETVAAAIAGFATGFVADELRHNRAAARAGEGDARLPPAALRLYDRARGLALGDGSEAALGEEVARLAVALREWRPFCLRLDEADAELTALRLARVEFDQPVQELHSQVASLRAGNAALEQAARDQARRQQQLKMHVASLEELLRGRDAHIASLADQVRSHGASLEDYNRQLTEHVTELARIKAHWTWRLVRRFMR